MDLCIIYKFLLNCIILLYYNRSVYTINDDLESLDSEDGYISVPSGPETFKIVTLNENGLTGDSDDDLVDLVKKLGHENFGINDSSKYDVKKNGTQFKYEFKPGVKCVVLYLSKSSYICKHKDVWIYDPKKYGDNYPSVVYFNPSYRVVEVVFDDKWYYTYKYDDDTWRFKLNTSVEPSSDDRKLDSEKLEPSTLNQPLEILTLEDSLDLSGSEASPVSGAFRIKVNDTSKYKVTKDLPLHYYDFEKNTKCVGVKFRGSEVWNFGFEKSGNNYPRSIVMNLDKNEMTVLFQDFYLVYKLVGGRYLFSSRTDLNKVSSDNLVIVTLDPSDSSKTKENDSSQYDVVHRGDEFEFGFKEGTKCVGFKYQGQSVWSFNEDPSLGFPRILTFDTNTEVMFLGFENRVFKIYGRNYGKFGFIAQKQQTEVSDSYMKIFTVDGEDVDYDALDLSGSEASPVSGTSQIKVNDTSKYKVIKHVHEYVYELNSGVKCVQIVCDNSLVWKHDPSSRENGFPKKISLNLFTHVSGSIIVHFEDRDLYYVYKNNRWKMYFCNELSERTKAARKMEEEEIRKKDIQDLLMIKGSESKKVDGVYEEEKEEQKIKEDRDSKDIKDSVDVIGIRDKREVKDKRDKKQEEMESLRSESEDKEGSKHKEEMEEEEEQEKKEQSKRKEDNESKENKKKEEEKNKDNKDEKRRDRDDIDRKEIKEDMDMRIVFESVFDRRGKVIFVVIFCIVSVILLIVFYFFYKRMK